MDSSVGHRTEGWAAAFLILGLLESFIGFLSIIVADYCPILNPLAIIAGTLGLAALVLCIIQSRSVKVYDILAAMLLVAYGTGTMNSVITFAIDHQALVADSEITQYWYSRTLGIVLAACGCLHVAGRIDPRGFVFRAPNVTTEDRTRVLIFATSIFCVYGVFLITGRIGYQGNIGDGTGGPAVSPVSSILTSLVTPAGALALFVSLRSTGKSRALLVGLALMLLVCQFGGGRRIIWFSSIAYAMVVLLVVRPKSLFGIRSVLIVVIAVFALQALSTFYMAMRMASYTLQHRSSSKITVLQLVPKAIEIYTNDERGDLQASVRENYKTRTFVLDYLTLIVEREVNHSPLYGDDLRRALIVATPSVLYPGKFRNDFFESEEPLINPRFGLPVWDDANSVLTAGAADFGLPGIFIYPLVLCVLYSLVLNLVQRFAPPPAALLAGVSVCQILLSAENDISFYFSSLIATLLMLGMAWVVCGWTLSRGGKTSRECD
jgi:hypothetical protein